MAIQTRGLEACWIFDGALIVSFSIFSSSFLSWYTDGKDYLLGLLLSGLRIFSSSEFKTIGILSELSFYHFTIYFHPVLNSPYVLILAYNKKILPNITPIANKMETEARIFLITRNKDKKETCKDKIGKLIFFLPFKNAYRKLINRIPILEPNTFIELERRFQRLVFGYRSTETGRIANFFFLISLSYLFFLGIVSIFLSKIFFYSHILVRSLILLGITSLSSFTLYMGSSQMFRVKCLVKRVVSLLISIISFNGALIISSVYTSSAFHDIQMLKDTSFLLMASYFTIYQICKDKSTIGIKSSSSWSFLFIWSLYLISISKIDYLFIKSLFWAIFNNLTVYDNFGIKVWDSNLSSRLLMVLIKKLSYR